MISWSRWSSLRQTSSHVSTRFSKSRHCVGIECWTTSQDTWVQSPDIFWELTWGRGSSAGPLLRHLTYSRAVLGLQSVGYNSIAHNHLLPILSNVSAFVRVHTFRHAQNIPVLFHLFICVCEHFHDKTPLNWPCGLSLFLGMDRSWTLVTIAWLVRGFKSRLLVAPLEGRHQNSADLYLSHTKVIQGAANPLGV